MRLGQSYKQHGIPNPGAGGWDAIVIGSGMGGLACAAMLARHARQRVLVLERHYTAGGFTHMFHRPGYEWDVGVHYIGEVQRPDSLMRRIFDHLSDDALAWEDLGEVYDQIIIGDDTYDFVRGRESWRAAMHDYFPAQRDAIDRYIDLVRAAVHASRRFFLEKALPPAVARVVGGYLRSAAEPFARATVRDVLAQLTSDARLRGVLAGQWGDYGLPPAQASFFMHALVVGHYFNGGAYPVGGSTQIAATIMPGIERAGGAVITSAEVERVIIERGRAVGVRLASGEEIRARRVISDAGRAITFGRLLAPEEARAAGQPPTLLGVTPSGGHLSLYVGLKKTAAELGLERPNQWVYPDHDHDLNVARYIADPAAPLPVAYLSFPSAKDPDFERRHPGRATIDVIGLEPWQRFAQWDGSAWKRRGADYESLKTQLSARLMDALVARCPQIAGHVDHAELSTPLTTKHFAAHPEGELYGLAHTPARFATQQLRVHTGVKGLYLTGADVVTAGVGGALMGGLITASTVAKRNMIGAVLGRNKAT
ncbi:MAG TPA: NAD(P)/FAD-dependent oxidoreductase [Polyangia bacterium]|nr:NAD(P)/FAD-dependent oxidoreductase [Polyangia bacterium]